MEYKIENKITPKEYNELRKSVGWEFKDKNIIEKALENSVIVKKATYNNKN